MRFLKRFRPTPALLVSAGAVAIAVHGVASGSVPNSNGQITACVAKRGGAMRIVDTSKKGRTGHCSRTERKLTWNQKGPQGIPGAAGSPGAPGAPGATHAVVRFATFTSDAGGQSGFVDVICNPGEVAVGGGIGWTQSPGSGDAAMYSGPEDANHATDSFPAQGATPTGWGGELRTSDGPGKTGRVYAICVSP
jgi:hypothetical protein